MSIEKDIEFIVLLEEMKKIYRRTKIIGESRRENDAEHTWHIATMALFLEKYAVKKIDVNYSIQMLLVHDLVEIYAGDTFAYDVKANEDKFSREKKAMEKLKSLLDDENAKKLETLWLEFEDMETEESKYSNAMDRLQPVLSNIFTKNGGTWVEGKVTLSQIEKRVAPIKYLDPRVYEFVYTKLLENVKQGYIINE